MSKANLALVTKDKSCAHSRESKPYDGPSGKDCAFEIIDLHNKISRTTKSLLSMAMRVGELLTIMKQRLSHGQFTRWLTENLPFSPRTAQNYMKVFRNKKEIKSANVSVLSTAYDLVRLPRIKSNKAERCDEERSFLTLSLYPEEKEWIEEALKKAKQMLDTDYNSKALQLILYEWLMSSFDQSDLMPLEDAKKSFEKIYNIQVTIRTEN